MSDVATLPIETAARWTTTDLESYPLVEGNRYEIIEGELLVSTQPHVDHQETCHNIALELGLWVRAGGGGRVLPAPGVIFDSENAVAPDIVWVSSERASHVIGDDGKLHDAPDLVVEVLSPGVANTRRDREAKLRLYSIRGVREYWIADWLAGSVQVYRREKAMLKLATTLYAEDELTSPLLPGFTVVVGRFFPG